jgi:hypothetical protein
MALGGGTNLRLAESVPETARALRKTRGHSRGILVLGLRADLLAPSISGLGWRVKKSVFASSACHVFQGTAMKLVLVSLLTQSSRHCAS